MLTVLIATYNGGGTLATVLDAYCKIDLPREDWKLVIVDNGSTDNTKETINAFKHALPLKMLFEPRRGKNVALKTGLLEIDGDLVVFSDDDVVPHPDWLKQFRQSADSQQLYSIFGGPILPKWELPPEEWILSWVYLSPTFGILNDRKEGPIENSMVFGGNMAIRSNIFEMGYTFDETIGPNGTKYSMGSETQLLLRLKKDGFKAWHCKNAVVKHMIKASQMQKKWVLGRAIKFGRGQYRLGLEYANCNSLFCGLPRPLFLRTLSHVYNIGKAKLSKVEERILFERWKLNYCFGIASEARNIYKEKKKRQNQRDDY